MIFCVILTLNNNNTYIYQNHNFNPQLISPHVEYCDSLKNKKKKFLLQRPQFVLSKIICYLYFTYKISMGFDVVVVVINIQGNLSVPMSLIYRVPQGSRLDVHKQIKT